jgi:hypothetical protein
LLTNDTTSLAAILTALATSSAPLAALVAIIKILASLLADRMKQADTKQKGVTLEGRLWIDVKVSTNS